MSKLIPTVGDSIIYFPTQEEKEAMANSGQDGVAEALPGIVVVPWGSDLVNAKIFLDGNSPDLWKLSINKGTNEGQWCWPHEHDQN